MIAGPMFPLGSVAFPGSIVPLRVFEPRYIELVDHCLTSDRRFGTVLIDRGSEVGGGDHRTDVGTCLRIVDARPEGGRWSLFTIAEERIRISAWHLDDPYPRATWQPDPSTAPSPAALERAVHALQSFLAVAIEFGLVPPSAELGLPTDPIEAMWSCCAQSPMGPADRQVLLAEADADTRMERFVTMLAEQTDLLRFRGSDPT